MITLLDMQHDYQGSQAFKKLSNNTKSLYMMGLNKLVDYYGHDVDVKDITPRSISQYYNHLVANHSENMAMRYLCGASAAFNFLIAMRDLTFNPVSVLDTNPDYDARDVVWTQNERGRFIKGARELKDVSYMASYIDFMYMSAQRVDEQRLFRYEHIMTDPESNERYFPVVQSKTRAKAPVWITDRLFREFSWYGVSEQPESGYLFTKKGQPVSYQTLNNDFKYIRAYCELRDELQMRDLRRSRASDLMATGKYSAFEVMALTGHTSEAVFRNKYVVLPKDTTQWMLKEGE